MRFLHEDGRLLVVDKGAGERVIPGRGEAEPPSLQDRLEAERRERLFVVHRLDAGTSGVLVLARDAEAHRFLSLAFERREVQKLYLALVIGVPAFEERAVELPLHEARRGKMRLAMPGEAGARPSSTSLRVRERLEVAGLRTAWIEALPRTGRHHQIRVHLKAIGHPLLFDPQYGGKVPIERGGVRLERTPLHAARIELPHPEGGRLVVEAPVPPDLDAFLSALRRDATYAAATPAR